MQSQSASPFFAMLRRASLVAAVAAATIAALPASAEAQGGSASRQKSCGECPPNYCENPEIAKRLLESKKQQARREGVPERLLKLYDLVALCPACVSGLQATPTLYVIYDEEKYRAKYGTRYKAGGTPWSPAGEKAARDEMREGLAKEMHIILSNSDCECCKRNFTPAEYSDWKTQIDTPPDWGEGKPPPGKGQHFTDASMLGADPDDLSEFQEGRRTRGRIDPGPMDRYVMPKARIIHVVCRACAPLADEYNEVVRELNAAISAYAEAMRARIQAFRRWELAFEDEVKANELPNTPRAGKVKADAEAAVAKRRDDLDKAREREDAALRKVKALQDKLPPIRKKIDECELQCVKDKQAAPQSAPQTVAPRTPRPAPPPPPPRQFYSPAGLQFALVGGLIATRFFDKMLFGYDTLAAEPRDPRMLSSDGRVGLAGFLFSYYCQPIPFAQAAAPLLFLRSGYLRAFGGNELDHVANINSFPRGTGTVYDPPEWVVPVLGGISLPASAFGANVPGLNVEFFAGVHVSHRKAGFDLTELGAGAFARPISRAESWTSIDPAIGVGLQYQVGAIGALPLSIGASATFAWTESRSFRAQSPVFPSQSYTLITGKQLDTSILFNVSVGLAPMLEPATGR